MMLAPSGDQSWDPGFSSASSTAPATAKPGWSPTNQGAEGKGLQRSQPSGYGAKNITGTWLMIDAQKSVCFRYEWIHKHGSRSFTGRQQGSSNIEDGKVSNDGVVEWMVRGYVCRCVLDPGGRSVSQGRYWLEGSSEVSNFTGKRESRSTGKAGSMASAVKKVTSLLRFKGGSNKTSKLDNNSLSAPSNRMSNLEPAAKSTAAAATPQEDEVGAAPSDAGPDDGAHDGRPIRGPSVELVHREMSWDDPEVPLPLGTPTILKDLKVEAWEGPRRTASDSDNDKTASPLTKGSPPSTYPPPPPAEISVSKLPSSPPPRCH